MEIKSYDMTAYNLHFIKTNKFKTVSIQIDFRRGENKKEATIRNLLKNALISSSYDYPSQRDLIIASESLYDIKISSSIARLGNYSNMSFRAKFLNEKYSEKDMNEESIKFLLDLIFNPNVKDNAFVNFDNISLKLRKSIALIKDNKLKYAISKLFEKTNNMPYSYLTTGNIADLDNIDGKMLYDYYKKVLKEDKIDIYVVGDVKEDKIKEIFRNYFKVNTYKKTDDNFIVKELKPKKRITKYICNDEVNQTQLTILCSLHNLTEFERNYVIKLYSHILGGSSNSLLFSNIREKNSYAYYVNCDVKSYDNIMVIYSGIEASNVDKVLKLVKASLTDMEKGNFSDDDFNAAIKTLVNSVEASLDSPFGMINMASSINLINSDNIEERIKKFKSITKSDVINVSKKVKLHSMLTLERGDDNEKNNS